MEHGIVYRAAGRFGGWPVNNGIWTWSDEIVVGFTLGYLDPEKRRGHPIQVGKRVAAKARSLDGGLTWEVDEHPQLKPDECAPIPCPGDITFTQPDFAMKFQRTGEQAGDTSWFYISYDRCKSWHGPYQMPMLGLKGLAARTDYQVYGAHDCLVFLTALKSDNREGRALCARTVDGGKTFQFVSWITPELKRFSIMPSTVRLDSGRFDCGGAL